MSKYEDMTCPKCGGSMKVSPGGGYIECEYCDYRKKLKQKDRTSINVSYVNNSYHDNRRYKYTDNTGKWDALKEIVNGEYGGIIICFAFMLLVLLCAVIILPFAP